MPSQTPSAASAASAASLTNTQTAVSRMVSDAIGFKWTSYNTADRAVARTLLLEHAKTAPEQLSAKEFARAINGKKHKHTKDFIYTLADAMNDSIWKVL
jgi:hypothetical protein